MNLLKLVNKAGKASWINFDLVMFTDLNENDCIMQFDIDTYLTISELEGWDFEKCKNSIELHLESTMMDQL